MLGADHRAGGQAAIVAFYRAKARLEGAEKDFKVKRLARYDRGTAGRP